MPYTEKFSAFQLIIRNFLINLIRFGISIEIKIKDFYETLIINYNSGNLTICSMRASSKGDRGAVGGGGDEEDGDSPSALLILSGSAAIICSANVSTLASSSPIKRNHHPSQNRKARGGRPQITSITTPKFKSRERVLRCIEMLPQCQVKCLTPSAPLRHELTARRIRQIIDERFPTRFV